MIVKYDDKYDAEIIDLWNRTAVRDGYKELDANSFKVIFNENRYFRQASTFVMDIGGVKGFACGCTGDDLPLGDKAGYITCIVLDSEYENQDNFRQLLEALEASFLEQGKTQSEVLFFNPMLLPWYIPGTPRHEHNNAPGVFAGSFFHRELLQNGYAERTRECAMYLNLSMFSIPGSILEKETKAKAAGYEVTLFDNSKHTGIDEMLKCFDNILWQKEISECTRQGIPVVIAARDGRAVGFAGPVIRQASGRGYFAGIGVNPEHEGHGLGSILFFKLCEAFIKVGAGYMSLYTGIENPAKNIYKKAGFKEVMEFAIMRKQILL